MKIKETPFLLLAAVGLCIAATSSMAAITPTSDDFDDSLNTIPNWTDVGAVSTSFSRDGNPDNHDWYDGDDLTYITNYTVGMEITGDGLLQDGGLFLNTQNSTIGDEALGLTIGGTMESNRVITFKGNLYNDRESFTDVNAQLWNLTDNTLLAESGPIRILNLNNIAYNTVDFKINYATQATDQGDQLQIQFREAVDNTARDLYVDNFSVVSEAGNFIGWNFNNDGPTGTVLQNDISQYDYTSATNYIATNAVANTLAFHGKSSRTDYIIRDKGGEHGTALFVKTLNTVNPDFGVYLQKLDFTLNGLNSSNITVVSWSFDILGYDQNGNLDPTGWFVKILADNNSQALNVSDAWFTSNPPSNLVSDAHIFDFFDDSTGETHKVGTWTTVSGTYEIPVGAAGSVGGIQISTDSGFNGGYLSSGGIFLDNIEVFITSKAPVLSEEFEDWANGFGITNAVATANPDGDSLNNLYEYALGGNPTNGNDTGYGTTLGTVLDGGTNYFLFVHPQRSDAAITGLNYSLESDNDLVNAPGWAPAVYEVFATEVNGFAPGINAVTNRISTEGKSAEFFQLQIDGL